MNIDSTKENEIAESNIPESQSFTNETPKSQNITWHKGKVTQSHRERLLGQEGKIVWFTGLSGSGKSTISVELEKKLHEAGRLTYRLDGDNIRHGLNNNLGFSAADRRENIRRIGEVAKLFQEAGVIVLCSFISPHRAMRDFIRKLVPPGRFVEVFVKCDVEVCKARDPKGLYAKAISGEIKNFTGISAPYEEPDAADIVVDTAKLDLQTCILKTYDKIL